MHPYSEIASYQHWMRSVAETSPEEIDPVTEAPFKIARSDKVATAGSCFAQHIARRLSKAGFSYLVTEQPPAALAELAGTDVLLAHNYGVFTARYGNIYTTKQLLQLHERAYGQFVPRDDAWMRLDGRLVDPFRPQIQPSGFHSLEELHADRAQHFEAVRVAFETLDVLVFTLGLTEAFAARCDGAVFPIAPGVAGGEYDADRYVFQNFGVEEVVSDLATFISLLRERNPACRIVLTVSPVPLMATAEPRHVLCSTTLSKAVLRVACDILARTTPKLVYFPSFEIVTGSFSRGRYFADNLRDVTESGVAHVMRLFMKHMAEEPPIDDAAHTPEVATPRFDVEQAAQVACDEEILRGILAT